MYPINVLNAIKNVPEVCRIFCATANPVEVIIGETEQGRGILGATMTEYKVKPKAIIASGGGHADPSFLKAAGKNARYLFDIVEWETDVNKPGADKTNEKFKKLYGYNLAGESVDAYAAMYVLADALERAKSTDPKAIRDALATTNLTSGPAMIVAYDAIQFEEPVRTRTLARYDADQRHRQGHGADHGVAQECTRRANYKPVFPTP